MTCRNPRLTLCASIVSASLFFLSPAFASQYGEIEPNVNGSVFDHNGSEVRIDTDMGVIAYSTPKPSLQDVVREGTVLFRGKINVFSLHAEGTAYAFKKGCPPAPYPVRGSYINDNATLLLRGAGPIRQGCEVVGYSDKSPHSVLRFDSMISP